MLTIIVFSLITCLYLVSLTMGNIFCKHSVWHQPDPDMTRIGNSVTNFHHGSSTRFTPETDCENWLPVTNRKLDKIREKNQLDNYNKQPDEASNGKPLLHASAPEGHIAVNSAKPHPGLYQTQSHLALKKLTNQDQNKKFNLNYKRNKKHQKNPKKHKENNQNL